MPNRLIFSCTLALALTAPLCAQASPLGAKPGAWETTISTSDMPKVQMPAMSPEQMAMMSPEQRAMINNMMQGKPMTTKHCVKATDKPQQLMQKGPGQQKCTSKIISQSDTRVEMEMTCPKPNAVTVHSVLVAQSSESFTVTSDVQTENGKTTHSEVHSRWIGPSCKGIPDYSQR